MSNPIELKPLHFLAIKYSESDIDNSEIRQLDITDDLIREMELRIEKGNLVNGQIRGEQTSGKSIIAFALTKFVNDILGFKFSIKEIAHDQLHFVSKVKDITVGNRCFMIDEWNELSNTGYNASTNNALLTQFNEVQAQRFCHKWCASPEKIIDPTARIILEVQEKVVDKKFTRCLVYYVLFKDGWRREQLVGYADINVEDVLDDPLYLAYRKRKFMKMELLMKHKIVDTRDIEQAKIVLNLVNKMHNTVKYCDMLKKDMIRTKIKQACDDYSAISILGEDKIVGDVYGTLLYIKNISEIEKKLVQIDKHIKKVDTSISQDYLIEKKKHLLNALNEEVKEYKANIEQWETTLKLDEEFEKLDGEVI